ncbi:uncharacterized protein TRIADDRAFT_61467 [Trichoplax adhaerens]|uniref:BZIP domain-containing protein n=1 Tax=Trichoplax adhaerens TaxID=10228 RepID=B3SB25_TRIAD|nr:predicted protein [Trichoplax adhaerens]EDV20035.1 predicted protein [Trichoplax adhaerens]|eukprot:XP_002117419.1 predicted protein [Trichoplax adhaerens]
MDSINNSNENFLDALYHDSDDDDDAIDKELCDLKSIIQDSGIHFEQFYDPAQTLIDWTDGLDEIDNIVHHRLHSIATSHKNPLQLQNEINNPLQNLVAYTEESYSDYSNFSIDNNWDINEPAATTIPDDNVQNIYLLQSNRDENSGRHSMDIIYETGIEHDPTASNVDGPINMGLSTDRNEIVNDIIYNLDISHDISHHLGYSHSKSDENSHQESHHSNYQCENEVDNGNDFQKNNFTSCSSYQSKNVDLLLRPSRHNDWTPNPQKLIKAGQDLNKLLSIMNNLTQKDVMNPGFQSQIRREKNKIASRICRLKKKQAYESNKIKLHGLEKEHDNISNILRTLKSELLNYQMNPPLASNLTWNKIITDIEQSCNPISNVAGRSSDYVREILRQVVQIKSEKE